MLVHTQTQIGANCAGHQAAQVNSGLINLNSGLKGVKRAVPQATRHITAHTHTNAGRNLIKGTELPRQTAPLAPGAGSPALQVALETGSALLLLLPPYSNGLPSCH